MDELAIALKEYFLWLENLCQLWRNVVKRAAKPMNAIIGLSEQLQAVSSVPLSSLKLGKFMDIKENMMGKILLSLEEELVGVIRIVEEIRASTDKLTELLSTVEQLSQGVCLETSGESKEDKWIGLSVSSLLEWASDSRQYYQAAFSEISIALCCLDFHDKRSVSALRRSCFENKELKKNISCILLAVQIFIHT